MSLTVKKFELGSTQFQHSNKFICLGENITVSMFYLVHNDHYGGHQGVIKAFSELETAKKYLDDRPQEFRRCGMIAVHADGGSYARMIVEIPLRVKKGVHGEYDVEEPCGDEEDAEELWKKYDIWNKALSKALKVVQKHVDFLSD